MIAIIADDLSGACDTAVKTASLGKPARVILSPEKWSRAVNNLPCKIVALSTNTRSLEPKQAYNILFDVSTNLRNPEISLVYKKVDSLLRGNVASEIKALMNQLSFEMAVVDPAVPDNNRFVLNGMILKSVNDKSGINAVERLSDRDLKTGSITMETISKGTQALVDKLIEMKNQGYSIIVTDSIDEGSMGTVSEACLKLPFKTLACGASGLIKHITEDSNPCADVLEKYSKSNSGKVLIVCGTANETTRKQIKMVTSDPDLVLLTLDVAKCFSEGKDSALKDFKRQLEKVDFSKRNKYLLAVSSCLGKIENLSTKTNGELSNGILVGAVSEATNMIFEKCSFDSMFLTGGETAYKVLEILDIDYMETIREFVPGVPMSIISIKDKKVLVATKSGGFGHEDVITKFISYCGSVLNMEK